MNRTLEHISPLAGQKNYEGDLISFEGLDRYEGPGSFFNGMRFGLRVK